MSQERMTHRLPSPLPLPDRCLLGCAQKLVPPLERADWLRTWQAELWCMHHRRAGSRPKALGLTVDLFLGLSLDAFWLRTDAWRRALTGTPALCLGVLLGFCGLSAVTARLLGDGWQSCAARLGHEALHCLVAAPLVIFVASVTASSRHVEPGSMSKTYRRIRQLFFVAKTALTLLLTFLLSADLLGPFAKPFPAVADLLQILFFVLFTLFGLRWSFHDQEGRCKQCLRSLATAARVGRPSHNLLEWNGTERLCTQGHGMLNVPEMETSWCQYSQWFDQDPAAWDQPASV